ncbi:L-rhamnose mutarotase [Kriegella sp. EG-1]|nr:L-rhamnose mutarotase [Flavobacteriaceae bacterium EG-1]
MIRKAFKMKLYSDKIEEYTRRHNPIWPELKSLLKNSGVHNYSIFFDKETSILFGYVEIESVEKWNAIASSKVCKSWWTFMADSMETNIDNSPISVDLEEVFYLS